METLVSLAIHGLSLARKDQLESRAKIIDAILDPSFSLPAAIFDGRPILYVKRN